MTAVRTWVLVADAERAEVYETSGPGTGLAAVEGMAFAEDTAPSRELGRDRPARTFDSVGAGRHAVEPRLDPHREQKREFARHVVAALETARARRAFDRLVLVAPPAFLGDLRQALPAALAATVASEIAKDLTRTPRAELPGRLGDAVRS